MSLQVTVGILFGLFVMAVGNLIGLVGRTPWMLALSLTASIAGVALFLSSGGIASIPVALIVLVILAPVAFVNWENVPDE